MRMIAFLFATLLFSQNSYAQSSPYLVEGFITYMEGGWYDPYIRVQLGGVQFNNPDNCSMNDGFITDPADQGNNLFNSMLLSASMANRKVKLTISGCVGLRPKIISVIFSN